MKPGRGRAILTGADIREGDFRDAHLCAIQATQASFSECDFTDADLRYALCVGSRFTRCNFTNADLRGAVFEKADLRLSDLSGANRSTMTRPIPGGLRKAMRSVSV